MNSDSLILRELINSPLTTKNDFLTNEDFDNNNINIYSDLVALCVTTGVIAFDEFETYDDTVLNYSTYNGRLYNYINASPSIGVTPSTDVNYWIEVFPAILAHKRNADTVLNEGGANEVTAAEIRAFIDAGLTTTTNLAITTKTATTFLLTSSTGTDVTIPAASRTEAGLLSAADKSKLEQVNGINTGDQSLASLGAEATANKATDFSTLNDVLFPTVQAVETQIVAKIDALVNAAPSALDTLNELAAALGDDANYAATMTSALATKEATANKQNSLVVDGTGVKFPTVDAVNLAINAIPSGITVGTTPITSGTDTRVLFQDGSTVGQDADITWNKTTNKLTLGASTYLQGGSNSLDSFATGWGLYNCGLRSTLSGAGNGIWNVSEISIGMASPSAKLDVKAGGALSTDLGFRVRNSADSADIFKIQGDGGSRLNGSFGVNLSPSSSYPLASLNSTASGYGIYGINSAANGIGVYGASTINSNSTGLKGESATAGGSGYRVGAWLNASGGASNWALYVENGDFSFVSTNGTKIGTATTQKLSFWNATPIVQPTTSIASATLASLGGTALTDTDTFDGYTLKQIVKALRNAGLLQ